MVRQPIGYAGGGRDLQREEGVTCSFSGICLIIIGRQMISQCRPPRPTTFLTTHCRPTNMDFVGFSFFIHALLGIPILNLQSFLYPSEPTKFSYSHFELTKFFSMNFHVVCLQGTFIRELLAQLHMYWLYFLRSQNGFHMFRTLC